jgi:hypothetical protein
MVSERRPRLILVVGTVVFVDTLLYAVLAPLLPGLAHGAVARATSDAVPMAITAGLCATTLVSLVLWGVQPELPGGREDV